jgi:hypothetical protein
MAEKKNTFGMDVDGSFPVVGDTPVVTQAGEAILTADETPGVCRMISDGVYTYDKE